MEKEELTSLSRTVITDTIAFPQGSEGEVIPVSEVHKLLTKIHNILDMSISKQAGNTTCIFAYLSASRQHHEVPGFTVSFSSYS